MILTMLTMLTIMFLIMKHPLSMGFILLIQSTLISLVTGMMSSFWYAYILFLIIVSAMLIMFLYMTSVASNKKFMKSNKSIIKISLTTLMIIPLIFSTNLMKPMLTNNEKMMKFMPMEMSLNKYLNLPSKTASMTMIFILFLTMIIVIKMTNVKTGPIRQKL
uniref:NADH deshydrogenase subunit 6 n=1 Tax=Iberobaenia minuta TaxID=1857294 RepID=A0A3G1DH91_9COLE|nr:NADH deshydrogenase subunit 6 [Iberobaenia minuta]